MTREEIRANLLSILRNSDEVRANDEWFMAVLEAYSIVQDNYCITWSDKTWGGGYNPNIGIPTYNPYEVTCDSGITREINTSKEL